MRSPGSSHRRTPGAEHRAPHRTRLDAAHPDPVLGEVQREQPRGQAREANAVIDASAHRPGSRLEVQVGLNSRCLEAEVHGSPKGQSTCQHQRGSE